MKLVLFYVASDECSWSVDVNLPFEHESAEAAIVDFERLCTEAYADPELRGKFIFAGTEFHYGDFRSRGLERWYFPEFYTLDEWFEAKRIDQ